MSRGSRRGTQSLPDESEGVLRFALPNQDIGAQELRLPAVGPNRFRAEGQELALPGAWRIEAIARTIGVFSWATELVVPVNQTPPPSPALNPAPLFAPAAVVGLIAVAIGAAGLAVSAAARGVFLPRRAAIGTVGVIALAAGAAILSTFRFALPEPAPVIALAAPSPVAAPSGEDDHQVMMDHHATPLAGSATPGPLPGPGTPVAGDGFTATLATSPESAEPVDVTVTLRAEDGSPLTGARVAVLSDMLEMAMGRMETMATETPPGVYVAEFVPLVMAGEWRVNVRISPKGAPTQTYAFSIVVP